MLQAPSVRAVVEPSSPRVASRSTTRLPACAVPLAVIVGELVTNSIKYAHPSGVAGQIRMSCHRGLDGSITIDIADDGVGFPQGFDPKSDGGLGLRVVHLLSAQLGASVTFESADLGLRVRLLVAGAPH